jgi:hypothetical protein
VVFFCFLLADRVKRHWLRLRLHHYICLKGHLSGSLGKACNLIYVNKGEATMISKRKRRNKARSRLEKKRRVKNGLRTSRKRFGLGVLKEAEPVLHRRKSSHL